MKNSFLLNMFLFLLFPFVIFSQKEPAKKDSINTSVFEGIKWRSIGPAFTSGRIADFAVNPKNFSEYYVAVASGHVWKTTNTGNTWLPIFDNYGSYSIGCISMSPDNPNVLWVGTGENNHQRALGYGDGVYKSIDGGATWKNMGLKESRQIGKIVIDPRNSAVVFVAAEGSVWGPGGERGLYKTIDGGKTWKKTLNISENTGVNNLIYDPRNPDVMYATSEQRRRHVFTKIGGGPESAVYKSYDAGETWEKIMTGLPAIDIGGMGIDISPVNPDIIYLIVEAAEGKGGFFRTTNRGASWEKMGDHYASGQYYNEIYCDPKDVYKVFSMETNSCVTTDGGKTWNPISTKNRHVDDHALWINPNNTDNFRIGGDGGIYDTFDSGKEFYFIANLPVTQLYRVNLDNSLPFYNVFGGTQDNNSFGGPSRTLTSDGIVNSDWFKTTGGDGFWCAVDPENPNIIYSESQYGGMVRYDKLSGEEISIRPEPGKGENTYKWNWNTPLFISPHKSTRLYCAANKVFRSDDRGNSWETISEDLTAQINRNTWPVMGKYWSVDAVAKDMSTSLYGEIISLCESPKKENLLYAGTDDGLIQVSEDAKTWQKFSSFPGVPENTYVSDILASKFDENIVYASFDNILRDDFKPYLLKSTDKGKSWKSIAGNLPVNGTVHTIEEDFVNPNLLFVGTEFGVFVTTDNGVNWAQLKAGMPAVAVRDIAIQKRECDLVIATFGRGFYILDNYSPLREISKELLEKDSHVFPVREALLYAQKGGSYGQGSNYFKAPNPDFGAVFTYYIKEVPKTLKQIRQEKEKALYKDSKPIPQPDEKALRDENNEIAPYLVFTVSDEAGNIVKKITKAAAKGIQRAVWDLSYQNLAPVSVKDKFNPTSQLSRGTLVMPGKYKMTLAIVSREGVKDLSKPVEFNVTALKNTTLPATNRNELIAFQKKTAELARTIQGTEKFVKQMVERVESIKQALINTPAAPEKLMLDAFAISAGLDEILLKYERRTKSPSAEENPPSPVTFNERLNILIYIHFEATSSLTKNELVAYETLKEEFPPVLEKVKKLYTENLKALETELEKYNAPWSSGRLPEMNIK